MFLLSPPYPHELFLVSNESHDKNKTFLLLYLLQLILSIYVILDPTFKYETYFQYQKTYMLDQIS